MRNMPIFNKQSLASSKQLLKAYQAYRAISREIIGELGRYIPKDSIQKCGEKLGIIKGKTLLFNKEDEVAVLFNYCYFHHYIQDKNALDRYVATNLDKLPEAKKEVALVMQKAKFSIFSIEKTMGYGGVLVTDIMRGRQELLIDQGFSKTAAPGLLLASTTLHYPEFITTSGTSLPLNNIFDEFEKFLGPYDEDFDKFDTLPKMRQSKFIAQLLRICLREQVSDGIEYCDGSK